ncbi:helix-turn-helix domain-containing protein [Lutibacter sp. B1]|uniref:helix-turn-helix domain-containing protein n=1 Tax=Lutibacter sp. B1 TaxID=2725996 RepID=UPI0014568C7E|nr:helix-turn-helix domain-containing protein [Lutibacter sp. B1]NLP59228.1 helix-turn-helix domain-containing protein [Lutibacter sp. B1]
MAIKEIDKTKLKEIENKLEATIKRLDKLQTSILVKQLIDNADFIQLMQISNSTAKNWRNKGLIPYAQIENKIYYKIEDIQALIEKHYKSFT